MLDSCVLESETAPTAPPSNSLLQGLLDTHYGRDLRVQLADALDYYTGRPNESVTRRRRTYERGGRPHTEFLDLVLYTLSLCCREI